MSEPWNDYAAPADDGPWNDYANLSGRAASKKDSNSLGFLESAYRTVENVNKVNPFRALDNVGGLGELRERGNQKAHDYFSRREQTEQPGVGGSIAGALVTTAPAAFATKNPFIAGGLQGAMQTEATTPGELVSDVGKGAALNWAGGKVIGAAGDALSPVIAPAVRRLADAGVKMTPGMVKGGKAMVREDKAMSRPIVGDAIAAGRQATQDTFNTAAVNKALAPLGKKVPAPIKAGHDAIDYAKREISNEYDRVVPNLSVSLNGQQFAQAVSTVGRNLKPAQQKQLTQIVSNELGNGQLAGQPLKSAQGNLRRLAGKFRRSQDPNDQLLGEALSAADDELTSAMIAQNPKWAGDLQKVNEAYRGYRIVADAAGRADDGVFNTGQLKQATRRGDFSKNKDATARGDAFFQEFSNDARNVISAKTPDPGTAGRLMAKNIFANARGVGEAFGYNLDNAATQFRLSPRAAGVARVGAGVKRLRRPVAAGTVALGSQPRD